MIRLDLYVRGLFCTLLKCFMGVMERVKQIADGIFHFPGAVNIVYVRKEDTGIIIDGGLEEARMKKVVKEIEGSNSPVTHIILTHAHADHFGGIAWLQKKYNIRTYAPIIEASIMESPILEPIYLFGGTYPLDELRNKFLEAPPIQVDERIDEGSFEIEGISLFFHLLPGHSYHQLGVGIEGTFLYAADSYFSEQVIEKHGVPYIVDAKATLLSIDKLRSLSYDFYLPGHGEVEENIKYTLDVNQGRHEEILTIIDTFVHDEEQVTLEEIMVHVLQQYGLEAKYLAAWLLYRTAILGYIRCLLDDQILKYQLIKNQLLFTKKIDLKEEQ
jgi:glyoxylase-like metal-dependent hydrolase (beta-lactamase superfamily II)